MCPFYVPIYLKNKKKTKKKTRDLMWRRDEANLGKRNGCNMSYTHSALRKYTLLGLGSSLLRAQKPQACSQPKKGPNLGSVVPTSQDL